MMMKIPKEQLDYLIFLLREEVYKKYKNKPINPELAGMCHRVACDLEMATGIITYSAFESFLEAILRRDGIKPDATNEEIYELFKLLGVEVVDE
jgi:hypothetical protein